MQRNYFKNIENSSTEIELELSELIDNIAFNDQGLVSAITQDFETREVLMMAWMNRVALEETIKSQRVTYWSRSRAELWKKGETSGHIQQLKRLSVDCDGDTLLCEVDQTGAACHTNRKTCFYIQVDSHKDRAVVRPL